MKPKNLNHEIYVLLILKTHAKRRRTYTDLTVDGKVYRFLWQRKPTQGSNNSLWYDMSYEVEDISKLTGKIVQKTLRHLYVFVMNINE